MTEERRQRADGTWTFTSAEWDARWYWPVGTRVRVLHDVGTVTKENSTTVRVRFDSGRADTLVAKRGLIRL
jgi:hypothetical protein